MTFEKDGYIISKNVITKDMCEIFTQYALFDRVNNFTANDPSLPGTHVKVYDNLMESLLLFCKPKIEECTGKKLIPTYSCFRVYKPGDFLIDHVDRLSCEISVSITLGYKYIYDIPGYNWPLHGYVNGKKIYFRCELGDAVIYKGRVLKHGRDRFDAGEQSYHVQVFLHYVDEKNPYSREYKYDKRDTIGIKKII
jgi:hypothetical protein